MSDNIKRAITEFFTQMGYVVGIPDVIMRIYSIIWMSDEPVSQAQIESTLKEIQMSLGKTVISVSIKELANIGALRKVKKSNDRTNYYEPDSSLVGLFQLSLSKILGPANLKLKNFSEKYKDQKLGQKLLKDVNSLHQFLNYIINIDFEGEKIKSK
ncbi:MAG: hypothetical protein ACTSRG_20775 [Candidatus Helarchaeota archaeon]